MAEVLNEVERRVFGVLLEKALAQPQYYPMSANAIVAACNQKSNRDPLMDLDEDAVWNTLEVLRAGGLVTRLLPGGASRVERYKHEAKEFLGWEKPQRAVMTELLLRGPQTVGELRTRCGRMCAFENTEAVAAVLDNLASVNPPRVATMPRAPGQSAVRYAHCLYGPEEWSALTQDAGAPSRPAPAAAGPISPTAAAPGANCAVSKTESAGLRGDIDRITAEISQLREELAELGRRVDSLGA